MTTSFGVRELRIFKLLKLDIEASKIDVPSSITQENSRILHVVNSLRPDLFNNATKEFEKIEITQYLSLFQTLKVIDIPMINSLLQEKLYLVGNVLTLADTILYDSVVTLLRAEEKNKSALMQKYEHMAGYIMRMSSIFDDNSLSNIPVLDGSKKVKKEKPTKSQDSAPKPDAKGVEAVETTDTLDPSKLDIRVGLVVRCWNHPESEKLLCEEIDVGEGSVRTIASGLRAHYTAEEVQGRKVLVLANLKERPMAGFMSQGMVLCACNEDHSVVRLLEPPDSAIAGDRVSFPGFSGEPAAPAHVAKKKILEKLAPQVHA